MAKIIIEVDTEEETLSASIDGTDIKNVGSVSVYKYTDMYENEDEISVNMTVVEPNKESGINKVTNYYTVSSLEGKKIDRTNADHSLPGFIGQIQLDPTNDINKYFSHKSHFNKSGV